MIIFIYTKLCPNNLDSLVFLLLNVNTMKIIFSNQKSCFIMRCNNKTSLEFYFTTLKKLYIYNKITLYYLEKK
jgi:hypothetical protein